MKAGQASRDLHLHVDGARLDAFERNRRDALHHGLPLRGSTLAHAPQPLKNI
jgi:hypothetical protein